VCERVWDWCLSRAGVGMWDVWLSFEFSRYGTWWSTSALGRPFDLGEGGLTWSRDRGCGVGRRKWCWSCR
jgi:hypothetical protein